LASPVFQEKTAKFKTTQSVRSSKNYLLKQASKLQKKMPQCTCLNKKFGFFPKMLELCDLK
jgi:PHP family Zn ribbon phosphoesterase